MASHTRLLSPLVALALVAPAPANSIFGFLTGPEPARVEVPRSVEALGFLDADALEFPAFQSFAVRLPDGFEVRAAPGMVLRTHRHMLARRKRDTGLMKGTALQVSRPLGSYADGGSEQGMLMGVMLDDARRQLTTTRMYRGEQARADFLDVLRQRLEASYGVQTGQAGRLQVRQVSFALRSQLAERERCLFLYRARLQELDGERFWLCDFYDPHQPEASPARRSQLRVPVAAAGREQVEISSAWAREADAEGQDPFVMDSDTLGPWARLDPGQLLLLDHGGDEWGLTEYRPVAGLEAEELASERARRAGERAATGTRRATLEDWVGGELEFGALDAAGLAE